MNTRKYRYLIPGTSHDTCYCCVFEKKHSATRHSTTPRGKARRHRAALRCALLSYSCAELSWEHLMWFNNVVRTNLVWCSWVRLHDTSSNGTWRVRKRNMQHSTQHGTAPHSTAQYRIAWHVTAPYGTVRRCPAPHRRARHGTTRHRTAPHGAALRAAEQ